jgi:hypothetical protein
MEGKAMMREDGKEHIYAVYFIHEDAPTDWGIVESMNAYNPGETVHFGGIACVIDFEI